MGSIGVETEEEEEIETGGGTVDEEDGMEVLVERTEGKGGRGRGRNCPWRGGKYGQSLAMWPTWRHARHLPFLIQS